MAKSKKDSSVKGLRIGNLYAFLMFLTCGISVAVLCFGLLIKVTYTKLINSKNEYSQCSNAVVELQNASNTLTQLTRVFAESQEPEYMLEYFKNVNSFKKRENALQIIESLNYDVQASTYVKMAYEESKNLEQTEYYSMRLVCDAINLDEALMPEEIKSVVLAEEDKALSKTVKLEIALNMLFDENYIFSQYQISGDTNQAIEQLMRTNLETQVRSQVSIERYFVGLIICVIVLFASSIIIYGIFMLQIYKPLGTFVKNIEAGVKMRSSGSYEMNYIAKAYNALCDSHAITSSMLKHKAEHDPLTGLINRGGYEQIKKTLLGSEEDIAYLIIDIDYFKSINDKYGHGVGDDILRKIATLLMEQFRTSDYVARIGGDEFSVIMTNFGPSAVQIIQTKILRLNELLQKNEDGLPSVSLSVGVAFSKNGYNYELEEQADKALYRVKRGGRCNCSFYTDDDFAR